MRWVFGADDWISSSPVIGPDATVYVGSWNNSLYAIEHRCAHRIQVFSPAGESLARIGSSGSGPSEFDAPGGVVVNAEGRLYFADFYNHRVQILEQNGKFGRQIGSTGYKGMRRGKFNYPTDVSLLPDGEVVVADAYNDRIERHP